MADSASLCGEMDLEKHEIKERLFGEHCPVCLKMSKSSQVTSAKAAGDDNLGAVDARLRADFGLGAEDILINRLTYEAGNRLPVADVKEFLREALPDVPFASLVLPMLRSDRISARGGFITAEEVRVAA